MIFPIDKDGFFTNSIKDIVDVIEPPVISGVFKVSGEKKCWNGTFILFLEAVEIEQGDLDLTPERFNKKYPRIVYPTEINGFLQRINCGVYQGEITYTKKGKYFCAKVVP